MKQSGALAAVFSSNLLAKVRTKPAPLQKREPKNTHVLHILPAGSDWFAAMEHEAVQAALKRRDKVPADLGKMPVTLELPGGCLSVWVRLDEAGATFDWHSSLRRAMTPLLGEHPARLDVVLHGTAVFCQRAARDAAYVAWLNGLPMPVWKSSKPPRALAEIVLHGVPDLDLARERALAEGNSLCRALTLQPPNVLTPSSYRARIRVLAEEQSWAIEEYDTKRLKKLKAGAFLAVARGSAHDDAAIVRLSYQGGEGYVTAGRTTALVGKGICFDTGGHNLKPARYMNNMHDDMNGSAVALGILLAATRLKLPVNLTVWLAIAQNHLSPDAYTQNEVVTALNGITIEIVHTDAEGRMVLADTLALAANENPDAIYDFATLTGSMAVALGGRMSGLIGNRDDLTARAIAAGQACGERLVAFPMPEDYDDDLDSQVADVKQCTLDSEADHILAARFLKRFVGETPWLHMDLCASRCKGGLGAVGSDITGFGVAWGLEMLTSAGA